MPAIRYLHGPDELQFGDVPLLREQWRTVPDELAQELMARGDVASYGFEVDPPPMPAPKRKQADTQPTEAA